MLYPIELGVPLAKHYSCALTAAVKRKFSLRKSVRQNG